MPYKEKPKVVKFIVHSFKNCVGLQVLSMPSEIRNETFTYVAKNGITFNSKVFIDYQPKSRTLSLQGSDKLKDDHVVIIRCKNFDSVKATIVKLTDAINDLNKNLWRII